MEIERYLLICKSQGKLTPHKPQNMGVKIRVDTITISGEYFDVLDDAKSHRKSLIGAKGMIKVFIFDRKKKETIV